MFMNAENFNSDLSKWDTSKVTKMEKMFMYAENFNSDLSKWDTSKIRWILGDEIENVRKTFNRRARGETDFVEMFMGASSMLDTYKPYLPEGEVRVEKGGPFTNYQLKTAVNDWFKNKELIIERFGHISDWDVSEVTDMESLFVVDDYDNWSDDSDADEKEITEKQSPSTFNEDLSRWNTGKVETMEDMFCDASSFICDLSGWDTSNCWNVRNMFGEATAMPENFKPRGPT